MSGLWRYGTDKTEGKYLIQRRDGTVVEWPSFVLGARDLAAPYGLRAYADACEKLQYDPQYVADVRRLADEYVAYYDEHGPSQSGPDKPAHRRDDPEVIAKMRKDHSKRRYPPLDDTRGKYSR